jgi:transposase-like protein
MKLKLEDKIKIIKFYKQGYSISYLSKKFNVADNTIERIERQYREHGIESFKEKGNNSKYPVDFKMDIIKRVLVGESITGIASELCVNAGMIYSWVKRYKELGYNGLIEKKKGRPPKMKPKSKEIKINNTSMDEKDKKIKELEERNAQLEMENDLLKKVRALVQQRQQQQNKKK